MKRTYKVNRTLLKEWFTATKEVNQLIESEVLKRLRISGSTWNKILYLEGYSPNPQIRMLLSQLSGIEESDLFIDCSNDGDRAA